MFWDTYNSLKHTPTYEYNPSDIVTLGDSGALLLLGALLSRIAGSKRPMEVLCRSHRTEHLKQNVRRLMNR